MSRRKKVNYVEKDSDDDEEELDFSPSEDEWQPKDDSDGDSDEDIDEDFDAETSTKFAKRRSLSKFKSRPTLTSTSAHRRSSGHQKRTISSLRNRMIKKYNPLPRTPTIPTSPNKLISKDITKILELSQYRGKKSIASLHEDEADDSDSSGDDHLVNLNRLDLKSSFFDITPVDKQQETDGKIPQFDCNVGLKLSDSENDEDDNDMEEVEATKIEQNDDDDEDNQKKYSNLIAGINQSSAGHLDFNQLIKYANETNAAVEKLKNINVTTFKSENLNVSKLLALGEGTSSGGSTVLHHIENTQENKNKGQSKTVKKRKKTTVEIGSDSDTDWEQVQDHTQSSLSFDSKDILQINIPIGTKTTGEKRKSSRDVDLMMKRKMNRDIKEHQLYLHKVSLICHLAHGHYCNRILNSPALMAAALKLLPNKSCYPDGATCIKYFESIAKWYKNTIPIRKNQMYVGTRRRPKIGVSLALQLKYKEALCKKDFVLIFIILMRAMGFPCRLVINLTPIPLQPPQSELYSLSTKSKDNKTVANKSKTLSKNDDKIDQKQSKELTKSDKERKVRDSERPSKTKKNEDDSSKRDNHKEKMKSHREASEKNQKERKDKKSLKSSGERKQKEDKNKVLETKDETDALPLRNLRKLAQTVQESVDQKESDSKDHDYVGNAASASNSKRSGRARKIDEANIPNALENKKELETDEIPSSLSAKLRKTSPNPRTAFLKTRAVDVNVNDNSRKIETNLKLDAAHNTTSLSMKLKKTTSHRRAPIVTDKANADDIEKNNATLSAKLMKRTTSTRKATVTTTSRANDQPNPINHADAPMLSPNNTRSDSSSTEVNKVVQEITKTEPEAAALKSKRIARNKKSTSRSAATVELNQNKPQPSDNGTEPFQEINKNVSKQKEGPRSKASTSKSIEKVESIHFRVPAGRTTRSKAKKQEKEEKLSIPQMDGADDSLVNLKKLKSKSKKSRDSDDDFVPSPARKPRPSSSLNANKNIAKKDRKVLSSSEDDDLATKSKTMDIWIEVYAEKEDKWVSINLFKTQVDNPDELRKSATNPVAYVIAWNNDNTMKDVSPRYCPHWHTATRKQRVDKEWLHEAIGNFLEKRTTRSKTEDVEFHRLHLDKPLPTTISEYKNHPLYALQRHLLKFEAIYPPDALTLDFIRGEPVYARDCVHNLHSRETWLKEARVVKPGEQPYKIVKARPKWDRYTNSVITDLPLEIFGKWQTMDYDPPTAVNGIVPRNAYGNVDLFKPTMLPKKTVHLDLPGLHRVCKKLKIDCAQAVTGFDFHQGACHPIIEGYVVCEEFRDIVMDAWNREQEEAERKEDAKYCQRVYGNWKKLYRGLLIRERLKRKYNFKTLQIDDGKPKPKKKRM